MGSNSPRAKRRRHIHKAVLMTDMTYGQSKRLGAFSAFGAGKKAMLAILRSLAGRRSRNEKASSDLLLALRLKISMPCVSLRVFLGSIFAAFMLAATTSSPAVATSGASVSSSPYSPAVVRVHQQEDEQEETRANEEDIMHTPFASAQGNDEADLAPVSTVPAGKPTQRIPIQEKIALEHERWVARQLAKRSKQTKELLVIVPSLVIGFLFLLKAMIKLGEYQEQQVKEMDIELYGKYIATDATEISAEAIEEPEDESVDAVEEPVEEADGDDNA